MEFDKSKVYTALNADELEVGDVVFVADTLAELKKARSAWSINRILEESERYRFGVALEDSSYSKVPRYALAYLIAKHNDPYKELKKAQAERKEVWFKHDAGVWKSNKATGVGWAFNYPVDYYSLIPPEEGIKYYCFLSDHGFAYDCRPHNAQHVFAEFDAPWDAASWCLSHAKFKDIARAWLKGKKIEEYNPLNDDWIVINNPTWSTELKYRIKPEVSWVVKYSNLPNVLDYAPYFIIGSSTEEDIINGLYSAFGKPLAMWECADVEDALQWMDYLRSRV